MNLCYLRLQAHSFFNSKFSVLVVNFLCKNIFLINSPCFLCLKNGLPNSPFLGGLSLHLNHLIASDMTIYDWPLGTLPFRLFGSNLDTRDLETYPRTYSGHF